MVTLPTDVPVTVTAQAPVAPESVHDEDENETDPPLELVWVKETVPVGKEYNVVTETWHVELVELTNCVGQDEKTVVVA